MPRIMHTGDIHAGDRQYGLHQRERDIYDTFDAIADTAIARKLDAVILAGDVFDSVKPPAVAVRRIAVAVSRLAAAGIRVLGIDGNHDISDGNWLRVCGIEVLDENPVDVKGVGVVGIPYSRPSVFMSVLQSMADVGTKADIVVAHQEFADFQGFGNCDLTLEETTAKLVDIGARYLALGHIHSYAATILNGVKAVFPGSPDMHSVDESNTKVWQLVDIDKDRLELENVGICSRAVVEVLADTEPDIAALVKQRPVPVFVITHDSDNRDKADAIAVEIGARCPEAMTRKRMKRAGVSVVDMVARDGFERKNSMQRLRDAISAYFDDDSVEKQIILELLSNPESVAAVVDRFLKAAA